MYENRVKLISHDNRIKIARNREKIARIAQELNNFVPYSCVCFSSFFNESFFHELFFMNFMRIHARFFFLV